MSFNLAYQNIIKNFSSTGQSKIIFRLKDSNRKKKIKLKTIMNMFSIICINICLHILLQQYGINCVGYPTGYRLTQSPFIRRSIRTGITHNVIGGYMYKGPYYINNFHSSTSKKLQPFYSINRMETYAVSMNSIRFSIQIINLILNYSLNRTQYELRTYFDSTAFITSTRFQLMFFHKRFQNYFFSCTTQINTPTIMQANTSLQTFNAIDLRVLFNQPSFVLPGPVSSLGFYNTQVSTINGIHIINLDNCTRKLPKLGMMINNFTHYQIHYDFNSNAGCTSSPQINYLLVTFIIYNSLQMQNYDLYLQSIIYLGSTTDGSTTTLSPSGLIPFSQNFYIPALIDMAPQGDIFSFQISAVNSDSTNMTLLLKVDAKFLSYIVFSMRIVLFQYISCDFFYDQTAHSCINACPNQTYHKTNTSLGVNSSIPLMYSPVHCSPCFYTCKTCSNSINCLTCDITKNRIFKPSTYQCIPVLGYYDNGSNNSLALPCYFQCKGCSIVSTKCTQCYDGFQLVNDSCIAAGCISLHVINSVYMCLACDPGLYFVYQDGMCKCDLGFRLIRIPNQINYCQNICGDGIRVVGKQQCDDGNQFPNDGCHQCKQQPNWICQQTPSTGISTCILYVNFYLFKFNYAYKQQGKHEGYFSYTIEPIDKGLLRMNWKRLLKLNISTAGQISGETYQYDQETGQLRVEFLYNKQLENGYLQTNLTFDPTLVSSNPSFYSLKTKINGINSPLIIQQPQLLTAYYASSLVTLILMILIMLQFYISSYFHKMIGLQTINVLQIFYFTKMIIQPKTSTLLNSINSLKLSTNGYSNTQQFFGIDTLSGIYAQDKFMSLDGEFISVGLEKYFLFNVNVFLIPLVIAIVVFVFYMVKKYYYRNNYLATYQQSLKDKYTQLKRSSQWIYDHFVFPYTLMFNMISFFNLILYLNSFLNIPQSQESKISIKLSQLMSNPIVMFSFSLQLLISLIIFFIYSYQIFDSYKQYKQSQLSQQQRQKLSSTIQRLQYDENSPDKANYHSLYVLVYLLYILLMQLTMVFSVIMKDSINISMELVFVIAIIYFIILIVYKPYHPTINKHNYVILFNQVTIILFIGICYSFQKLNKLSVATYITMISFLLFLLFLVGFGGYLRIFLQRAYRKWLEENSMALRNNNNINEDLLANQRYKNMTKKEIMLLNNDFFFINQLKAMKREKNYKKQEQYNNKYDFQLGKEQQDFLVQMIKKQYKKQLAKLRKQPFFPKNLDCLPRLLQSPSNKQKFFQYQTFSPSHPPQQNTQPLHFQKLQQKFQDKFQNDEEHNRLNTLQKAK